MGHIHIIYTMHRHYREHLYSIYTRMNAPRHLRHQPQGAEREQVRAERAHEERERGRERKREKEREREREREKERGRERERVSE